MIDSRYFYRVTTHKQMFLLIINSSWRPLSIIASIFFLLLGLSTAVLADNHQGGDSSRSSGSSGSLRLPASNLGNWYLDGELKAAIFIDTVHNDPTIRASRTEVFGDDGSNIKEQGSDNSRIPTDLDDDGNIETSRPIATDTPEFGGTITGSRLTLGNRGANHNVLIEGGFFSNDNPYTPQLYRLWAEYGIMGIGLGWSTFMDFKGDNYPRTFDYTGPVGAAYARQIALRVRLSDSWYFGLEEPQDAAYLGFNNVNSYNEKSIFDKRRINADASLAAHGDDRTYEVDNKLRTRHFFPNLIFTYYGQGKHINFFSSILLQRVELDDNSPLFLESDEGLTRLIDDTRTNVVESSSVDNELQLNDDLSGGLGTFNAALHLGVNGAMRRGSSNKFNLAYIYNGGRYLRDNPNPAHIVVSKDISCNRNIESCDYELVNIISHSYLMDFTFREKIGLIFSGTVTDNDYGTRLGGAATKQVHGTYLNFYQEVSKGLNSVYEIGYSYRQAFNTRSSSEYPRLRLSYGLNYSF